MAKGESTGVLGNSSKAGVGERWLGNEGKAVAIDVAIAKESDNGCCSNGMSGKSEPQFDWPVGTGSAATLISSGSDAMTGRAARAGSSGKTRAASTSKGGKRDSLLVSGNIGRS